MKWRRAENCHREAQTTGEDTNINAPRPILVQVGCRKSPASTANFRRRLPAAAKIALVTAGTMGEVPASLAK